MAGADAIRGFNFQHARALHAAIDLVEDAELAILEVEGNDDVVDFQLLDSADNAKVVAQIKTRKAPGQWNPADLLPLLRRWDAMEAPADARFEFVSDGVPGPEMVREFVPALERAASGASTPGDVAYWKKKALTVDPTVLARFRPVFSEPAVEIQLDLAELRIRRLLGLERATSPDPEAIVDRLFRLISVRGGRDSIAGRRVTRFEVAAALEIDLATLDQGQGWDNDAAASLRQSVSAGTMQDAIVVLGLAAVEVQTRALRLVEPEDSTAEAVPRSLAGPERLVDLPRGAALTCPSGRGKSTALATLAKAAASEQLTPVVVSISKYQAGTLLRWIVRALEELTGRALNLRAGREWLESGEAFLLVDGVTERPLAESQALVADLRSVLDEFKSARVVAAGRDEAGLRGLNLPVYSIDALTSDQQLQIAETLIGPLGSGILDRLRTSLADTVQNPLLLRMALSVASDGVDPESTFEIYQNFLAGLNARTNAVDPATVAALNRVGLELVRDQRYSASASWWRSALLVELDALSKAGMYERGTQTGESALSALLSLGILTPVASDGSVRFLHDSFRDYVAASAMIDGLSSIARPLDARFEASARFLAEGADPSPELLAALCDNPVAASAAASAVDPWPEGDRRELAETLLKQLLGVHALPLIPAAADLRLLEFVGSDHDYFAVVDREAVPDDSEGFDGVVGRALIALSFSPDAGPLRVAISCWQELLRFELDALEHKWRPRAIPTEDGLVVKAVEQYLRDSQAALFELAERACPSLAGRVLSEVRWNGFEAAVGTAVVEALGGGFDRSIAYTRDTVLERVWIGDDYPEEADGNHGSVWGLMRQPPEEEAHRRLEKAYRALLPTWGPG